MNKSVLLQVEGLTIGFPGSKKNTKKYGKRHKKYEDKIVVNDISFSLEEGEILGIVGESGSGKSMTAYAIMDLLPDSACITKGRITFLGKDLTKSSKEELRELKGTGLSMIFQEPMTSFNPVLNIGKQVEEMLCIHSNLNRKEYKEITIKAFEEVGLENAEEVYCKYPHELSGGMRQRAMLAMAMILGPKLIIADEPTTALDVIIQDRMLKLLKKINQTHGTAIIFVSHDLGVIKNICDRTLVMKDGKIVESGNVKDIFLKPGTDYTKELITAAPVMWNRQKEFIFPEANIGIQEMKGENNIERNNRNSDRKLETVLAVEGLKVSYRDRGGTFFGKTVQKSVVKNASLQIYEGEALGLVGESGCGKTTLAKAVAGLIENTEGTICLSESISKDAAKRRIQPQMVFQDPYSSLNPARRIRWILEEPLKIHGEISKKERRERVVEVIRQVGLSEDHLERYVSQLSGGQRQRVAIAAALILYPKLIILDEPVSSLDVTVQAQILNLLKKLKNQYQLSYLFISHDLNVVYQMCDRICVMHQGEIIETGSHSEIFSHPIQEYTKELLTSHLL